MFQEIVECRRAACQLFAEAITYSAAMAKYSVAERLWQGDALWMNPKSVPSEDQKPLPQGLLAVRFREEEVVVTMDALKTENEERVRHLAPAHSRIS